MSYLSLKDFPSIQYYDPKITTGTYKKTVLLSNSLKAYDTDNVLFTPDLQNYQTMFSLGYSKNKHNGFLLEILFHGLNFNAKRIRYRRPKYFVDVHKSEIFTCDEPAANNFKSRVHKRRLIFFSYDRHLLTRIEKVIKEFKLPDAYTGKGLFSRLDPYKLKQGKTRKK